MPKRMVLDTDPITGRVRYFYELPDGRFAVESETNVEPVLEQNKDVRRTLPYGWKGDMHLVASIPHVVYQQLQQTWRGLGLSTEERRAELRKLLNNGDYSAFRVKPGKV